MRPKGGREYRIQRRDVKKKRKHTQWGVKLCYPSLNVVLGILNFGKLLKLSGAAGAYFGNKWMTSLLEAIHTDGCNNKTVEEEEVGGHNLNRRGWPIH